MSSKFSRLATAATASLAGLSVFAGTALWIGCGGSSATTASTTPDSGGVTTEAGSGTEAGTANEAGTDAATKPDASITGPYLDIQFGSCPALTACGGDPKGLFKVTAGCVDDTIFAGAKMQCPGLTVTNPKFQARGTVLADATTITRKTDVKFTATFGIPKVCKDGIGAGTTCADVATAIMLGAGLDMATCTDAAAPAPAGDCTCDVGNTTLDNTTDMYTTAGNVLTTGSGTTSRTYDYCVMGSEVKYKQTTAKTAIPALFTLTK
jgi:hypothetical protein